LNGVRVGYELEQTPIKRCTDNLGFLPQTIKERQILRRRSSQIVIMGSTRRSPGSCTSCSWTQRCIGEAARCQSSLRRRSRHRRHAMPLLPVPYQSVKEHRREPVVPVCPSIWPEDRQIAPKLATLEQRKKTPSPARATTFS
jgi:hypothetical protein